MKITRLHVDHVLPRWSFLTVETDTGLRGYGEPIVEGQSRVVEAAVAQMAEYLVGQDPRQIERHWQVLYRGSFYRGGPVWVSALSGIEQALWDITGKSLGVPVHALLGGSVRDRVRLYPHCRGESDQEFAADALRLRAEGFSAVKIGIDGPVRGVDTPDWVDRQVSRFAAIRQAVGQTFDIAIDLHGRTSPAMAMRLVAALEPYSPLFVEEPCLPENVDALVDVARSTSVPIATGERLFTKFGFRDVIERRAVAILQPDLCHAGGILEAKKIAAMGEAHYMSVAPHNPLGPVSLAACIQLAVNIPNFLIQEFPAVDDRSDLGVGLLVDPIEVVDGCAIPPTTPGLGIELDESLIDERRYDGSWQTPMFQHDDGSHGDW